MSETLEELKRECYLLWEIWWDSEDGSAEESNAYEDYLRAEKRYRAAKKLEAK